MTAKKAPLKKKPPFTQGAVYPQTEKEWEAQGHTPEEIRAFSTIGLVLVNPKEINEYKFFEAGWAACAMHSGGYTDPVIEEGHIIREFNSFAKK